MGTKRRHMTTDELMHMVEARSQKRRRSQAEQFVEKATQEDAVSSSPAESDNDSNASASSPKHTLETGPGQKYDDESEEEDLSGIGSGLPSKSRLTFLRVNEKSKPATGDSSLPRRKTQETFSSLGVSAPLEAALSRMSIHVPTEIQVACIPQLLAGRDCIGNAKTGSGKTVAFAIPILQRLSEDPYGIFALVLTPTRELAFQISDQFTVLGASLNIRTSVIVGGLDMMTQALELDTHPHVVVATPGRIVDHLRSSSGQWSLSRIKFLILDEADRLLAPTFASELAYLFNVLPQERQTCLFTATLTPSIDKLVEAPPRLGKSKPFFHKNQTAVETVSTLKQHYILVPSHVREPYLYHLLCHPPDNTLALRREPPQPAARHIKPKNNTKPSRKKTTTDEEDITQPPPTIIFCTKPRTVAYLTEMLKTLHIRSTALHSRLTQRERLTSISLFRSSVVPVLVSTDVGSRGLDIEDVAMVINWDIPNEPEEYTHRVGRTARAGKAGIAISLVTEKDEERVLRIEERIGTSLEEMTLPEKDVLEKLNAVSTAKRVATLEVQKSDFDKRESIHRKKKEKMRADADV